MRAIFIGCFPGSLADSVRPSPTDQRSSSNQLIRSSSWQSCYNYLYPAPWDEDSRLSIPRQHSASSRDTIYFPRRNFGVHHLIMPLETAIRCLSGQLPVALGLDRVQSLFNK
eukprot:1669629-Amphidinium_carterae.1